MALVLLVEPLCPCTCAPGRPHCIQAHFTEETLRLRRRVSDLREICLGRGQGQGCTSTIPSPEAELGWAPRLAPVSAVRLSRHSTAPRSSANQDSLMAGCCPLWWAALRPSERPPSRGGALEPREGTGRPQSHIAGRCRLSRRPAPHTARRAAGGHQLGEHPGQASRPGPHSGAASWAAQPLSLGLSSETWAPAASQWKPWAPGWARPAPGCSAWGLRPGGSATPPPNSCLQK